MNYKAQELVNLKGRQQMKLLKKSLFALCLLVTGTLLSMKRTILPKPPTPEQRAYEMFTAMDQAVTRQDDTSLMEKILSQGVDINHLYNFEIVENQRLVDRQTTALMLAARKNNEKMVDFLLKKGANPDLASNSPGQTPLHIAASQGYIEIVRLLLKKGASINARDSEGNTPLFFAVYNGQKDMVTFLLRNGADQNIGASRAQRRTIPLSIATLLSIRIPNQTNYSDIVRLLTRYASNDFLKTFRKVGNEKAANNSIAQLDQPLQDFMKWFKNGSKIADIAQDEKKLFAFIAVAFTMYGCLEELQSLLALVKKEDYKTIFTPQLIQEALMMRNVEVFKILIPLVAQDRELVNRIRDELDKLDDPATVDAVRKIIKNEAGKFSMSFPSQNLNFLFKEPKRKYEEVDESRKKTK